MVVVVVGQVDTTPDMVGEVTGTLPVVAVLVRLVMKGQVRVEPTETTVAVDTHPQLPQVEVVELEPQVVVVRVPQTKVVQVELEKPTTSTELILDVLEEAEADQVEPLQVEVLATEEAPVVLGQERMEVMDQPTTVVEGVVLVGTSMGLRGTAETVGLV